MGGVAGRAPIPEEENLSAPLKYRNHLIGDLHDHLEMACQEILFCGDTLLEIPPYALFHTRLLELELCYHIVRTACLSRNEVGCENIKQWI
jgi:hypothetical protein